MDINAEKYKNFTHRPAAYAVGSLISGRCLWLAWSPPKAEWLAGPLALMEPLVIVTGYSGLAVCLALGRFGRGL